MEGNNRVGDNPFAYRVKKLFPASAGALASRLDAWR